MHQLQDFVNTLCAEEQFDAIEGQWTFRSGGSCCRCTDTATKVAKAFAGRIVGYSASRNLSALIGAAYCEGHDFALIKNRFIVDYWAFRVARLVHKPVLDLNCRRDRKLSARLYGKAGAWQEVLIESE